MLKLKTFVVYTLCIIVFICSLIAWIKLRDLRVENPDLNTAYIVVFIVWVLATVLLTILILVDFISFIRYKKLVRCTPCKNEEVSTHVITVPQKTQEEKLLDVLNSAASCSKRSIFQKLPVPIKA